MEAIKYLQQLKKELSVAIWGSKNIFKEVAEIKSLKSRKQEVVIKKIKLIKELREVHKLSFPRIGELFGNDHSTIMTLYKTHKDGYSYKGISPEERRKNKEEGKNFIERFREIRKALPVIHNDN